MNEAAWHLDDPPISIVMLILALVSFTGCYHRLDSSPQTRTEAVSPGSIEATPRSAPQKRTATVYPGTISYVPPMGRGDSEGVDLEVVVIGETRLSDDRSEILSRAYMVAQEYGDDDKSRAEGWSEWTKAYTAPAGWKIVRATPLGQAKYEHKYRKVDTNEIPMPDGVVVHSFYLWLDERDNPEPLRRVKVKFNPVVVELEKFLESTR
jgi:hypothetical protein